MPEDTRQLTGAADLLIPVTEINEISCLPQNSQGFSLLQHFSGKYNHFQSQGKSSFQFSIKKCWPPSADDHLISAETAEGDGQETPKAADGHGQAPNKDFLASVEQRILTEAPLNSSVTAECDTRD